MGLLSLLVKDPVLFAVPAALLLYSGSFGRAGVVSLTGRIPLLPLAIFLEGYSFAPASLRSCTTSSSLLLNAIIEAVTPLLVLAFTFAPCAISAFTTSRWPS